jgi:hypothetical protein
MGKKHLFVIAFFAMVTLFLLFDNAGGSNSDCEAIAFDYAKRAVEKIYHGGTNITVKCISCEIENGSVKTSIILKFDGNIDNLNKYEVHGVLTIDKHGSEHFKPTYFNDRARRYLEDFHY